MKKALWVLSSLALVGFAFTACDDDSSGSCSKNDDCDDAICAPMTDGSHACVPEAKLSSDHECYDSSNKSIIDGWALKDNGYGDFVCEMNTHTTTTTCKKDSDCTTALPFCDVKANPKVCVASNSYYKYVRIDDDTTVDTNTKSNDPGADIDAVVLVKNASNGGGTYYAVDVKDFERGDKVAKKDGKQYAADPAKVLDKPDSLINYGKSDDSKDICYYYKDGSNSAGDNRCNSDTGNSDYCGGQDNCPCDFNYTFYSLGGGHVVVEMGGAIEEGDQLDIVELSNCRLSNTGSKKASDGIGSKISDSKSEQMKVYISVSSDLESFKQAIATNKVKDGVLTIGISSTMVPAPAAN